MEKLKYIWIPILIEFFTLFNSVFIKYGVKYLYMLMFFVGFVSFIRRYIYVRNKVYCSIVFIYILTVFFSSLFNFMIYGFSTNIILGTTIYILPILYWLLYDREKLIIYFPKIVKGLRYPVLVIAILGILQFYVSPGLFGLIDMSGPVDPYVLKASSDTFSNWFLYLRATSILPSPQVFGLFMVLYSILLHTFTDIDKGNKILILIYLFSGAHSGNKSFFLILILYVMYYVYNHGNKIHKIITIITLFLGIVVIISFSEEINFLNRIFNFERIIEEEKQGRLSIYSDLLKNVSFFGSGAGSYMTLEGNLSENPAESYFLQILLELGIIPFLFFSFMLIANYFHKKINRKWNIILILIAISMVFVHCFNAFVFFPMWATFFLLPYDVRKNNKYKKEVL